MRGRGASAGRATRRNDEPGPGPGGAPLRHRDSGAQVGPAAELDGPRGGEVRLASGGSASAQLALVNVANYDPAACRPTPVRGLRVYPPGDTAALFVAMDGTGCAGTPPGPQLRVRTVQPG